MNADSAVAASEEVSVVSDNNCVKTESMQAFLYIHSEQPKVNQSHIDTKDLVEEFLDDALRDHHLRDTEIKDITIDCENKKVRGGNYVGYQKGQVPFDDDFNMDFLKNTSRRPYVFKVKVKVKYQRHQN